MTLCAVLLAGTSADAADVAIGLADEVALRRPIALIQVDDSVIVGNRRSGTLSTIDSDTGMVVSEISVGKSIADIVRIPGQRALLVIDDSSGSLLKVGFTDGHTTSTKLASVPTSATRLTVSSARREVFVTARWARRLLRLRFDLEFSRVIDTREMSLPFAPQELLLIDDDRYLVVADAFRGRLAVVDPIDVALLRTRTLEGHNIRGLAAGPDGKRLYISHQTMYANARADYEDVHWGTLVTNAARVVDTDDFLSGAAGSPVTGWLDEFGGIGSAAGDPTTVVTGSGGLMAVALSGIAEVALRTKGNAVRIPVGRRPEAMTVVGNQLFVANRFDDSVSIIDIDRKQNTRTVRLGPTRKLSSSERGELLFFDARLSHDGWMSCHSCHTDGHSSELLVDTLGDGDYGAPKRVPSLLGTRNTGPWAWNGSAKTLADQVSKSVTTTMHGDPLTERQTSDLVAYLETLRAPPSPNHLSPIAVRQGSAVFSSQGCVRCHAPPLFTTAASYDVGLIDERNRRSFNPPSLRGVSQRDRLFHDGRYSSVEEAVLGSGHRLTSPLSQPDSAALIAFLKSL